MLNREQMAWRVAQDLPEGKVVNLGIGMPVAVADFLPGDREIFIQSENGLVGAGRCVPDEIGDFDLIDAGSRCVELREGGCVIDSLGAFSMIRGGHVDISILGGFEVAGNGDFANWSTGESDMGPLVGGAMDLASSARSLWVMMAHTSRQGAPRLLERCSLPLTGARCVSRVFTDLAIVRITGGGFVAEEIVEGVSIEDLAARTGAAISIAPGCRVLRPPSTITRAQISARF